MKAIRRTVVFLGVALATLVLVTGCGPGKPATVPVSGTVTLDGSPLEGAAVTFTPAAGGRLATGTTDASGKFTLMTFVAGDGAIAGSHKVGVSKMEAGATPQADPNSPPGTMLSGPPGAGGSQPPKSLIPKKYSNPEKSGITVEVKSGMEPVTIELSSK